LTEQDQPESITIVVRIDEANLILEALGNLPFRQVYQLIAKLQEQARRQIAVSAGPDTEQESA
jgi:hypothetical protein